MIDAVLNLVAMLIGTVAVVVWVVSMARWDGKPCCDKSKCNRCQYSGDCEYEEDNNDE